MQEGLFFPGTEEVRLILHAFRKAGFAEEIERRVTCGHSSFPCGSFRGFAPVALPRLCRGLRPAAAILRQRAADVGALLDPALRVAPDVALVAARRDQFVFAAGFFAARFFVVCFFNVLPGEFCFAYPNSLQSLEVPSARRRGRLPGASALPRSRRPSLRLGHR
jgi:hypothetical protein